MLEKFGIFEPAAKAAGGIPGRGQRAAGGFFIIAFHFARYKAARLLFTRAGSPVPVLLPASAPDAAHPSHLVLHPLHRPAPLAARTPCRPAPLYRPAPLTAPHPLPSARFFCYYSII